MCIYVYIFVSALWILFLLVIFVKDWVFLFLDCFLIMGFLIFLWGFDSWHAFLLFLCSDHGFFGFCALISGVLDCLKKLLDHGWYMFWIFYKIYWFVVDLIVSRVLDKDLCQIKLYVFFLLCCMFCVHDDDVKTWFSVYINLCWLWLCPFDVYVFVYGIGAEILFISEYEFATSWQKKLMKRTDFLNLIHSVMLICSCFVLLFGLLIVILLFDFLAIAVLIL